MKPSFLLIPLFGCLSSPLLAQEISRSFELRYFSSAPEANGETDFKGPTAVFNTEQRVTYLNHYADYATRFFRDPELNTPVVSDAELDAALQKLKPQPLPDTRRRIPLDTWRWLGFREGQHEEEQQAHQAWLKNANTTIVNGALRMEQATTVRRTFPAQAWRFFLELELFSTGEAVTVALLSADQQAIGEATVTGNQISVRSGDETVTKPLPETADQRTLRFEVDLENQRYNVLLNGQLVADFVPVLANQPFTQLSVSGPEGLQLQHVFGQGYTKAEFTEEDNHSRDYPYFVRTFVDEDFRLKPSLDGWQTLNYDDAGWGEAELPYPHGGDRFAEEFLYLRKVVELDSFQRAVLSYETLDPGGEIWVNGRVIEVKRKRTPGEIDLTEFLQPDTRNILAVRVFPNRIKHASRHSATDVHTGWFAGRMHLDLTRDRYLKDVFAYATSYEPAVCHVDVVARSDDWGLPFHKNEDHRAFYDQVRVSLYEWYPTEKSEPSAVATKPIYLNLMHNQELSFDIPVKNAQLWSVDRPFLYKVHVELLDSADQVLDDMVVTTGLRTISQDGGVFAINGKPAMMNGALLFGFRPPLHDISRQLRAGPKEWLAKEILMVKKMNGNTLRMSVHNDQEGGINDPRLAEIADQLGLMFQWTTGTWVRKLSPWTLDIESVPAYVKQVRNHPSIVMWQLTNHPNFKSFAEETVPFLEQVYGNIYPYDPSRLIAPTSNIAAMDGPNDVGTINRQGEAIEPPAVWNAPMMTIGDMDHATGYGAEWNVLRNYPNPPDFDSDMGWRRSTFKEGYINSPVRAYFDFESEENAAQPNWNLFKGQPYYEIKSYEYTYDEGSIGRRLAVDEWRTSQAWQAFSGFEAYKKKRWLGYDGMTWCPLHGGGNMGTYMKPIIDYHGNAKLGFYALRTVFQDVVAGTHNVDIVLGPEDNVAPVVMNLGPPQEVNLLVMVKDTEGQEVARKEYQLTLPEGRTATTVTPWNFRPEKDSYYALEYRVRRRVGSATGR
jgi:hypothetical protein